MAFTSQKRDLYGGSVTLHFNPKSRNRYQLSDGTAPVGVTTILSKVLAKEALMLWPMNMALGYIRENAEKWESVSDPSKYAYTITELTLEEAAQAHVKRSDAGKDTGSEVHELIERFLNDNKENKVGTSISPNISQQAFNAFLSFTNWFNELKPEVVATEQIVYSRAHGYAGTFDALLKIDNKIILCDVKTSNASQTAPLGIYHENFIQLGAYSLAYREAGGSYPADLLVINASKTGKLSTIRASELSLSVSDCEGLWLNCLSLYKGLEPVKKLIKEWES